MAKKTFAGDVIAASGVVYDCEEITGSLDATGADARRAFPRLTAVGGSLNASGDTNGISVHDPSARETRRNSIFQESLKVGP